MFIQKDKKYEKYEKSSRIVMVTSMFLLFITLILKIIFEWSFLDYIANILKCGFILSLFIDAVPDFLEKNIKRIIWDLIFILIMILIFYLDKVILFSYEYENNKCYEEKGKYLLSFKRAPLIRKYQTA